MAKGGNEGRAKKWWYHIALDLIPCVFFLLLDYATSGILTWSVWACAIVIFFAGASTLLDRFGRE